MNINSSINEHAYAQENNSLRQLVQYQDQEAYDNEESSENSVDFFDRDGQ